MNVISQSSIKIVLTYSVKGYILHLLTLLHTTLIFQWDIRRFRERWSRHITMPCSLDSRPPRIVRTSVRPSGTGVVTALSSVLPQRRVHWARSTRLKAHRWAPHRAVTYMTVSCNIVLFVIWPSFLPICMIFSATSPS